LRNFAVEYDYLFATASQLNRSAVEEIEFDHSHISGGLSKIQTADNVIGIFTSQAMRERGRYQVQFMKTRSSAGVGQKVDLAFDIAGLRITDLEEGAEDNATVVTNDILAKAKANIKLTDDKKSLAENSLVENNLQAMARLNNLIKRTE